MGKPAKDITGVTVGYVTAIKKLPSVKTTSGLKPKWLCRCVCGAELHLFTAPFLKGQYQSCGCKKNELISKNNTKHGMSHHSLYAVWDTMIARCHRDSHKSYKHYSTRGITVCEQWRQSFQNFANDMLGSYSQGLQLDRIDNNKGYSKENCRWVDAKSQANNTSANIWIDTPVGKMTVKQAAEHYNIKYTTLLNRVYRNWPNDKLFISVSHRNRVNEKSI